MPLSTLSVVELELDEEEEEEEDEEESSPSPQEAKIAPIEESIITDKKRARILLLRVLFVVFM